MILKQVTNYSIQTEIDIIDMFIIEHLLQKVTPLMAEEVSKELESMGVVCAVSVPDIDSVINSFTHMMVPIKRTVFGKEECTCGNCLVNEEAPAKPPTLM